MKINTNHPTNILSKLARFLGVMLVIAFILPATVVSQSSPTPVNLGTAGDFVILTKAGITAQAGDLIIGNIGVSPIASTAMTGFGLIMDPSNTFSTSSLVNGKIYAADYTSPTPAKMTAAISDMKTAYNNAAGRTLPDYIELYAGNLTGQTLTHGLYKWGTDVLVSAGGVTISGSANDVWIFQIAGKLILASGAIVTLSGGAQASNIFWQVAGEEVTLGTNSEMKGIILCNKQIVMNTGVKLNGRALAETIVTLAVNTAVTSPSGATAIDNDLAPQEFALFQNYPNPFNPSTRIRYSLEKSAEVTLKIYNLLGIEVATLIKDHQDAGSYTISFNTNRVTPSLSSGVYLYRLEAGSFVSTRKLILIK
jgi:hypothetical protein